ncbi:MAG TPA: A24 family peptidase [Actinomycetes bacterium]|nr:A24 family peptidase [Actinomycetes bacterium]
MLAAVVSIGLLGVVVGGYLPGVIERVPAGQPVLVSPAGSSRSARRFDRRSVPIIATTAIVYALLAARFGFSAELPAYLYGAAAGIALAAIDLAHHRLPNALTLPSYLIACGLLGLAALVRGEPGPFLRALGGMAALYALYYLLMLIYPAGMGFGDVKLAGVLGLYLGWLGWAEVIIGGFLGFVIGALAGLGLLATRRATRKSAVPFGPAMLLGALIAVLAGTAITDWYLGGMTG